MPAAGHLPGVFAQRALLVQAAGRPCRVFSSPLQQSMEREEESVGGDPEVASIFLSLMILCKQAHRLAGSRGGMKGPTAS